MPCPHAFGQCMMCFIVTLKYVDLQKSSYLPSTQKDVKYLLVTVYMLEIPSIIRIIAEIDLLKLCDLEPQGYKVRDSKYFTCA